MPDHDNVSEVVDLRQKNKFEIDTIVVDQYLPAIGGNAFQLYTLYCRVASSYDKTFPSFRAIQKHTGFSFASIQKFNDKLEEVGLLKVVRVKKVNGERESNKYMLLNPKGFSADLKEKYYPKNWQPLIKFALPSEQRVLQKLKHPPASKNEAPVLQKLKHINNKDLVVVFNNKTTTRHLESICNKLASVPSLPQDEQWLLKSAITLFKTACNLKQDPDQAVDYIEKKLDEFTGAIFKANKKLNYIQAIIANDWTPEDIQEKMENKEFIRKQKEHDQNIQNQILAQWQALSNDKKSTYYKKHIIGYHKVKHHKIISEPEITNAINTLVTTGSYLIFNLQYPPIDFKGAQDNVTHHHNRKS